MDGFLMDLQLFGGGGKGGGSSSSSSYEPSEQELAMMNMALGYANETQPNAIELAHTAKSLLDDSMATTKVDYRALNDAAQKQIAEATQGYRDLIGANTRAADTTNAALGELAAQYMPLANAANASLADIAGSNTAAASRLGQTLGSLANGNLPTNYNKAMENSIRTVLNNTLGAAVNNLAGRGVINSSVSNKAINDISANAADTVAQQYGNNIDRVANLANGQFSGTMQANNANAGLTQQQLGNSNTALDRVGSLTQQQYSNTMGANQANQGLYGSLLNSATAPITAASAAQEAAAKAANNIYNMSFGLNGQMNSALSAARGGGTTTQHTSQDTGLLNGLAQAATIYSVASCFPAGTQVDIGGGASQNIEKIKQGDTVKTASGMGLVKKILNLRENAVFRVRTSEGYVTHTTLTQPLLTDSGKYVLLKDLTIGTNLANVGPVIGIDYEEVTRVYDFEVEGDDNSYIVDGGFVAQGGNDAMWRKEME